VFFPRFPPLHARSLPNLKNQLRVLRQRGDFFLAPAVKTQAEDAPYGARLPPDVFLLAAARAVRGMHTGALRAWA
jgi:hypothetical protein